MGREQLGWFFYGRDYSESQLRIGSIAFDYRNPLWPKGSYIHSDDPFIARELLETPRSGFSVQFGPKLGIRGSIGLLNVYFFGGHWEREHEGVITAPNGVEKTVQDYDNLKRIVLPAATPWMNDALDAAFQLAERGKNGFRHPKLWLCTGLVVLEDATYKTTVTTGHGAQVTATEPIHQVSVSAGYDQKIPSQRSWTVPGKSIAGAQWMLLYCTPTRVSRSQIVPDPTRYVVELRMTYAKNVRDGEEDQAVMVKIETDGAVISRLASKTPALIEPADSNDRPSEEDTASKSGQISAGGPELYEPTLSEANKQDAEDFALWQDRFEKDTLREAEERTRT